MSKDTESIADNKSLPARVKDLLSDYLGSDAAKQYTAIPQRLIGFYGSPNAAYFVSQLLHDQTYTRHWEKWVPRDYSGWEAITGIKKKALSAIINKLPYVKSEQRWYGSTNKITGEKGRKILHVRIDVDKYMQMLTDYLANLKYQNDVLEPA